MRTAVICKSIAACGLALLVLSWYGCMPRMPTQDLTNVPTVSGTSPHALRASPTSTQAASLTPTPTLILTSSLTPAPILASATVPPNPTLTKGQRDDRALRLLETNGNCTLPCFWSLIAGETSWEEGLSFMQTLYPTGKVHPVQDESYNRFSAAFDIKRDAGLSVTIYQDVNKVGAIEVMMDGLFKPDILASDWRSYTLESVLNQMGVPSRIIIGSDTPHEPPYESAIIYDITLAYYSKGVTVYYEGSKVIGTTSFTLCPEKEARLFALYIRDPSSRRAPHGWSVPMGGPSLEDISSLTTEQFYRLFTQANMSRCFAITPGK